MGWLSRSCSRCVGDSQMKTILVILLVTLSGFVHSASVAVVPPASITATSGGFTTASSFTGSFSAAAFNNTFTTNVGGKAVTMPATMRMAANAGSFAASAVRLNPAGLLGTAAAAWLLSYGLQWINGQWMKQDPPLTPSDQRCGMTALYCVTTAGSASYGSAGPYWKRMSTNGATCYAGLTQYPNIEVSCSASGSPANRPATDADWSAPQSGTLPDAAASELAPKIPLPLQNPEFNPKYSDVPLGDPYRDPVTGKRYQDKARVTPQSDGKSADVQVSKTEVDDAGNPAVDSTTNQPKAPEKVDDPCKLNPEASGCKQLDEPADTELQKKDNPFSLNPVSGFGPDNASCPSPQQLFVRGGQSVSWDWGQICTFAQGMRPLVIGFAWLFAIMMVVAVGRRAG